MIDLAATFAAGYFLGALPFAAWFARLTGRDLFQVGSGNMGAMNAARNIGYAVGVAVLLADVGKGLAAAVLGALMTGIAGTAPLLGALVAGVGAVVGHAWSVYVRFRGGKALATTLGAMLAVAPLVGLYALLTLIALVLLLRRTTAAALLALAAYPFIAYFTVAAAGRPHAEATAIALAAAAAALVSAVKHLFPTRPQAQEGHGRRAD